MKASGSSSFTYRETYSLATVPVLLALAAGAAAKPFSEEDIAATAAPAGKMIPLEFVQIHPMAWRSTLDGGSFAGAELRNLNDATTPLDVDFWLGESTASLKAGGRITDGKA